MKKRIKIIVSIILIIVVLVGTGTLLAYLTSTDTKTNVFTVGRIKIELEEANWVSTAATNLRPGDTLDKDPKINNIGKNSAYVYIKVINPIVELMNNAEGPLFTYTINQGWTQLSTMDDCNYRITTYYYNTALNANASTPALFDEVTLNNFGPNVETIQDMNIYAYGIQSRNVGTNIPTIFSSHFSNNLSDTTLTCPGMVPDYNGEGCANITNDSSGGGGNANMSGLTLMMKNASLGTDENIDFTLPYANWIDDNFSGSSVNTGPTKTTTAYYTYANSYTFNPKTGLYTLTNPSVGRYSDIYSSLPGKYIVSPTGTTTNNLATTTDLEAIYKVTNANSSYTNNSFIGTTYSTRSMSTTAQGYYYTYASSYSFDSSTGTFSLTNPSVGKYSNIYSTLPGKYIVSYNGSSSSSPAASTNRTTIYKVGSGSTLTSLHYQSSAVAKPMTTKTSTTIQNPGDNEYGVYTREGTENDKYPIYYYRGDLSLSNNVVFGGFCWKIVRTTASGGIRMIYNGEKNSDNSCGTAAGNTTERTSTQNHIKMTQGELDGDNYTYTIGTTKTSFYYNVQYEGHNYVGYMYETSEENDTDSNLKRVLDAWYSAYLTSYDNKIEDSIYCNDRTYIETTKRIYCSHTRVENATPTTLCTRTTDAFGVNSGNKKSTYKVGFLTSDEVILAGRSKTAGMRDYLYNNNSFWLGSPSNSNSTSSVVYLINNSRGLNLTARTNVLSGVRPVITLNANTNYTGTGTLTDPFIVN